MVHGSKWEPSGDTGSPLRQGWAGGNPDTHSVFGIDVQAQGQKVFHNLHLPRPDCHMQRGAQQLGGRKQIMLAEGTWALVPLRVEGLSTPAFSQGRGGNSNFPSSYLMI